MSQELLFICHSECNEESWVLGHLDILNTKVIKGEFDAWHNFIGYWQRVPIPDRFLSSMLVTYKGKKILIDCGEGTQVSMRKFNTGFKSLDIICISHVHGDHIYGLPGLLSTLGNSDRTKGMRV